MFAVDVCNLPETGGSMFVVIAGLFLLVAGVIVTRWVRQSAGRLSVVVAPLVLLGGFVLAPQVVDPCAPTTTIGATSTVPQVATTVPQATTATTVPSAATTVPSAATTVPSATTTVAPTTTTTTTTTVAATTTTVAPLEYQVGNVGPGGGIVFYVDLNRQPGSQYFEAAPVGVEVQRSWATGANQSAVVSGADGTAIGTGEQNTADIVAQSGNLAATSAAVYCSELVLGGESDWFLPSKNELNVMFTSLHSASPPLGGFSTDYYWSSSESDVNDAWAQNFNLGNQSSDYKGSPTYVRPVRAI